MKMSHTWVSSSSSQAQRSSSRRRVHHTSERPVNHQTPDTEREVQHKRGQNAWDLSEEERYGNGHRQTVDKGDEREEIADSYRSGQTSSSGERPLQRRGGYYVQNPKPAHNDKLVAMAQKETAAYEQHKVAKKAKLAEQSRHYTPQELGGASFSTEEQRKMRAKQEREQQLDAKYARIHQKQKREEYVQAKRRREEKELEDKKRTQREKAVHLEQKQEAEEQRRREDLRRKRLAHFDSTKNA